MPLDARDGDRPVLQRLPKGLQRRPVELGQLVEEEHAAMRKGRLAGPRTGAAADDRRGRRRVMRRSERRPVYQWSSSGKKSRDRVDSGDLERLLDGQLGEDPRESPGEHRLACPRRACEEEVVPPGRRDLQGPSRALLPANVGQVRAASAVAPLRRDDRWRLAGSAQIRTRLRQVLHCNRLDSGQRCFGRRLRRTDEAVKPCPPRRLRRHERSGHRANATVQRELAEGGVLGEPLSRNLMRGRENRQCNGKIEARALLPQTRGSEVDRDAPERPFELGARDSAPYALLRLLACLVRQADDGEPGHAALEVSLHLDRSRFEPYKGMSCRAREHISKLRRTSARMARGWRPNCRGW